MLSKVTCFNIASDDTGQSHFCICLRLSCDRVVRVSSSNSGMQLALLLLDFVISRVSSKKCWDSPKIGYVMTSSCQIHVILYSETC
jgi:hypothetical protein